MKTIRPACLVALSAVLCLVAAGPLAAATPPSLGEWSSECNPAFRVAAMPSAWTFNPAQGPLEVTARVAVDYPLLPAADWELEPGPSPDEPSARLTGYRDLLLEARVLAAGEIEPLARLDGRWSTDDGSRAVVFAWDGRDSAGAPVPAGRYALEVHGRFIPVSLGVEAAGLRYRDLDGWGDVAEACFRVLRVEVSEEPQPPPARDARSALCPSPPPLPANYYDTVDASSSATLRATLHNVVDDHVRFPYTSSSTDCWDILNDADENPSNTAQLLDVYKNHAFADGCSSGCSWNREHSWPQSFGFPDESGPGRIPYTDCHHLRAADGSYNGSRGNKPFNNCTVGCTAYPTEVNNGFGGPGHDNLSVGGAVSCSGSIHPTAYQLWETWDHRKGDTARSMLYMDLRYAGDSGSMGDEPNLVLTDDLNLMDCDSTNYQSLVYFGILSTLVAWSNADPPDADEIRRNEQVWCQQENRNPFVDHPEWVSCLFLDECGLQFAGITGATDLDPCAVTGVQVTWNTPSDWDDGCTSSCNRGFKVYRSGSQVTTGGCAGTLAEAAVSCVDSSGATGVTYDYSVQAVNHVGTTADGGVVLDAADRTQDGTPPLITAGPTAAQTQTAFTANWTTDEPSTSYLEWGIVPGVRPYNTSSSAVVANHALTATGLSPSTQYYYRVCSTDPCGNGPRCSDEASVATAGATVVFVNELHYDNVSTDANEGFEIAATAGTDLAGWSVTFYNGYNGTVSTVANPNPAPLSGVIADAGGGLGFAWFPVAGVENGPTDGFVLVDDSGTVVQFLCYEGTFTAVAGPANGLTCTDIGVSESNDTTPTDASLQLTGGPGCAYEDFTWTGPVTASHGAVNAGQTVQCLVQNLFADGFESGTTGAWSATSP